MLRGSPQKPSVCSVHFEFISIPGPGSVELLSIWQSPGPFEIESLTNKNTFFSARVLI
jgi:hypothetical protein